MFSYPIVLDLKVNFNDNVLQRCKPIDDVLLLCIELKCDLVD